MSDKWLWTEALPRLSEAGRAHPHQFDIHGGGIDLAFPHHENEMAQSRCAHGTPLMAQVLDAQRLPAGRGGEDGEVAQGTS